MDFDRIIDRRNTNSLKYDFTAENGKPEDVIPLWVADMDFAAPPQVIRRLTQVSQHGIFGYSEVKGEYFEALSDWYWNYFGWKVEPSWLVKTPGVVYAICTAIRSLTKEGDAVMVQQPVYYPFVESVRENGRRLINNPLVYREGKYQMDFEDMEQKIKEHRVKLFLLCSPHNPVGRVWTREELVRLGEICVRYGVIVVADEIHADFVYPGNQHRIFTAVNPEFQKHTITCTAPSKTFNLAGLQVSNIFIADREIRGKFQQEMHRGGYSQLNPMGLAACQTAYQSGKEWLEELKKYLWGNLNFLRKFLEDRIPQVHLVEPEGTYLVWLDCRGLGFEEKKLDDFMVHQARLWLDAGVMFGQEGSGFERINIACPRKILEKALKRLESALRKKTGSSK